MNGILVINKPEGWTSHDVVAKIRRVLRQKRIGHGGTLDPMATGVLPLFIGKATRAVQFAESYDKEYTAALRTGIATDTQDITGTILSRSDDPVTEDALREILEEFHGEIEQVPPMYSAIKLNGRKLYEYAREGKTVERKPRRICINSIELLQKLGNGDYLLKISCSKGTYIRTLCHDIGQKLGCGGTLASLVRTKAGIFGIENSRTLDEVVESENPEKLLTPVDTMFSHLEPVYLDENGEKRAANGATVKTALSPGLYRVYSRFGEFLMLSEISDGGLLRCVKNFL